MPTQDEIFMRQAIDLSRSAVAHGNEPFGAVLVKDGEVVFTNEPDLYDARSDISRRGGADPPLLARPASRICVITPSTPVASPASCAAAPWYG